MLSPKLSVSNDKVASGSGLIASESIQAGEVLWRPETKLPLVSNQERQKLKDRQYYSQIDLDLFVRNYENEWYFNHSCAPNCVIKDHVLVAVRDIAIGEEVTYDYGLTEITITWSFWCSCGSDKCRTHITNLDYLNTALCRRMHAFCPDYAEQKASLASLTTVAKYKIRRILYQIKANLFGTKTSPKALWK